jgi:hypothetical protein
MSVVWFVVEPTAKKKRAQSQRLMEEKSTPQIQKVEDEEVYDSEETVCRARYDNNYCRRKS